MPAGNKVISVCNHEEADTRLVLHASKVDSDAFIVCKDTDVLILMIWTYSKMNITNNWYLKYDHKKFADIRKTCSYLGKTLSLNLPKIHALTGCDTTSYFYRVGKIKVFKKLLGQQDLCFLLSELGNYSQITNSVIEDTKEFIRTVLYNGDKKESYVNTRVKLCKGLKQKSSCLR